MSTLRGEAPYDCKALRPYRRQHSGITAKKGLWEVHRDPYDVSRIWVRNHHDGGWIQATWTHLNTGPAPFGDLAWDHAQKMLARRGIDRPTEEQIAQAARDLLDRAEQGPNRSKEAAKQDLRVAARTRATIRTESAVSWPRPEPSSPTPPPPAGDFDDPEEEDEDLAKVIPLGVFDAAEEAKKRW